MGMSLANRFYDLAYGLGRPRWDTGQPVAELVELVGALPAGRALDIGCGTGTNCLYLAEHGWKALGIDFSRPAIDAARRRAVEATADVRFVQGDATRLSEAGIRGSFDLVVDVGCFHGLSRASQLSCARGVVSLTAPGAEMLLLGVQNPPLAWRLIGAAGAPRGGVEAAFGADFEIRCARAMQSRLSFTAYRLVRR
jgi:SAM-dependent methyltransferase